MHITLTGSLGHIGNPLTTRLVAAGHTITVVSSSAGRAEEITALGAVPAVGKLQDVDFLSKAFHGAEVVYTMVPPANYFDHNLDLLGYYETVGHNYAEAIRRAGVQRVVNLSSIGAHLPQGNGILQGTYHVESILNELSQQVAVTHIRPTEFYYNLYAYLTPIKQQGVMGSNLAAQDTNVWVAPTDIAVVVAEEIVTKESIPKVRYVASDTRTYQEVATALGKAVGKPDLRWEMISDKQFYENLKSVGMQPSIARGMVEMYAAIHSGLLYEDYQQHQPATLGEVKIDDFAREFAVAYREQ
ncbi:NmrA family NAD(P)-binding protein [Neolewinella sp.]|uniref:NmrA family NAD(P)-binding protein n=1 Tax=Neolewinella sp. TaxID=2993543 RepID=UPI003B52618C